jgi:uncharacterized protein
MTGIYDLSTPEWLLAFLSAFFIGFSKTGITGVGALPIAIFANIFPSRQSTGIVLPLLICADAVAVKTYHHHAKWNHLIKLLPWTLLGILIGFFVMGKISNEQVSKSIGVILIVMIFIHVVRQKFFAGSGDHIPHHPLFSFTIGILGGFTTMIANAAGPLMVLYMIAMRLPKLELLGTGAWYFFTINTLKVPFSCWLNLITWDSLKFDLLMIPMVLAGAFTGKAVVKHINQKFFEWILLLLTFVAGLRLLLQ